MENMLKERWENGEPGAFLLGERPTHADFCVFAFVAPSLLLQCDVH